MGTPRSARGGGSVRTSAFMEGGEYEPLPGAQVPLDRYYAAYFIFYVQGIGQLLPWNAFITAGAYYTRRFCGTPHALDFENYFSVTFMVTMLVCQALLVRIPVRSIMRVIQPTLALQVAIFAATAALVLIKSVSPTPLFAFTNICVALCGACAATLQAALFGFAALFPPAYTQAMMAGQGMAGLIVAAVAIITALTPSNEDVCAVSDKCGGSCTIYTTVDYATFGYFAAAMVCLLACMASYAVLHTLPFTRYHGSKAHKPHDSSSDLTSLTPPDTHTSHTSSLNTLPLDAPAHAHTHTHTHTLPLHTLLRHLGSPALAVFLTFGVTLSIFPSITEHILSVDKCTGKGAFYDSAFVPLQFFLFNLLDFMGRSLAGPIQLLNPRRLWLYACARVIFFPLFLLCNVEHSVFPVVFAHDALPLVFMLAFALSNGYISSLSMMYGPLNAPPGSEERAGNVMVFLLTLGLSAGSGLSFVVSGISSGWKVQECR